MCNCFTSRFGLIFYQVDVQASSTKSRHSPLYSWSFLFIQHFICCPPLSWTAFRLHFTSQMFLNFEAKATQCILKNTCIFLGFQGVHGTWKGMLIECGFYSRFRTRYRYYVRIANFSPHGVNLVIGRSSPYVAI